MPSMIQVDALTRYYPVTGGLLGRKRADVRAVDGVDLNIQRGECLGLVGESGCGKTSLAKTLVRLDAPTQGRMLFYPAGRGTDGAIDYTHWPQRRLKKEGLRRRLQMVFQDPTTSMNPRMLIKHIIAEPLKKGQRLGSRSLEARVLELLEMVGLTRDHYLRYPHEFSGGQRQRIAIARAVATQPDFLVLDEPTSALDVSVQAQILNLLQRLQQQLGLTYLFVSHHLLVVKYISQRVAVMYLGKMVEMAPTGTLFEQPRHPYTHALLSVIPVPEVRRQIGRIVLEGDVPSALHPPAACRFNPRCPFAIDICRKVEPPLVLVQPGHKVACHRQHEVSQLVARCFGR